MPSVKLEKISPLESLAIRATGGGFSVRGLIEGVQKELIAAEAVTLEKALDSKPGGISPSFLVHTSCVHAIWLYARYAEGRRVEVIQPTLQRIFDNGSDVHSRLQRYLSNHLYGTWGCKKCDAVIHENDAYRQWVDLYGVPHTESLAKIVSYSKTWMPRPTVCPRCGGESFVYREWRLFDLKRRIKGKTDGILRAPSSSKAPRYLGLEIKSANSMSIASIKANPASDTLRSWKEQEAVYLRLAGLEEGVILVENKNTQTFDFEIPIKAQAHKKTVDAMLTRVDRALKLKDSKPVYSPACKKCDFQHGLCAVRRGK